MVPSDVTRCRNLEEKSGLELWLTAYIPIKEPIDTLELCSPIAEDMDICTFWCLTQCIFTAHELWTSMFTPGAYFTLDRCLVLSRLIRDCGETQT